MEECVSTHLLGNVEYDKLLIQKQILVLMNNQCKEDYILELIVNRSI